MHIKSYRSRRFAGIRDIDLEFDKGINIILGPNESGKSTIIDGIHSTLFKNIRLKNNNNADKDFSFRFMPQPSGDFIDGEVILGFDNEDYKINKEWGSNESIELLTPEGNIIKNEKDVVEELSKILSFGESTYSNIVFAKQRELKMALNNILDNNEINKEVNDLLRMTLMELDGISIDSIESNIKEEIDNLYKRWDRSLNYPENRRGINNPYKVGLGKIVESFYKKEELKVEMEEAERTETEFEDICAKIKEYRDRKDILTGERDKLEKIENDVRTRSILNAEINSINKGLEVLMKVNKEWPINEQLLKQLEEKSKDIEKRKEEIIKEKANIEKINRKNHIEKILKDIEDYEKKISEINEEISKITNITNEDINKLDKIQKELLRLETSIEAGKMIGELKKVGNNKVYIKTDFEDTKALEVNDVFEANGLINIKYNDEFEIEIKTGEIDFEELNNQYKSLNSEEDTIFKDLNIESIEEGKENLSKINSGKNNKSNIENNINLILDNSSKEELLEELEGLKDINTNIDLEDIDNKLNNITKEEIEVLSDIRSKKSQIEEWIERYTDHDNLFDLVIEERTNLKEKEKQLEKLKPLPKEFETAEEFSNRLIYLKNKLNKIEPILDDLNREYYESKNNLLDDTYEELRESYLSAKKTFERNINRGEKLLEIQSVFLDTKERLSKNPMDSLVNEFIKALDIITDGRYKDGEIDEDFNIRLENPNGEIPIQLLSAGTYDSVSLALRFSLLKHIFKDIPGGYVVLDDCLVDLDPLRKEQAVELINEFSKDYQIIFTTCDPETAKMLGGRIIELG